jgi:Flp pilus assembly pilin Flp
VSPAPPQLSIMVMPHTLSRWLAEEDGQDLVEYVLLGGAVAFAGLLVMNNFDDVINAVYTSWDAGTQAIWEPQDPQ